ncbi:MAG: pseudouridine synthase [Leptospiraceae bacterium]
MSPAKHPVILIQETEDYAAFYKPAGLVFFEDSQKTDFLDEMRALCSDQADRLYPVHRLDKVTSGILLCAKGRKNANLLGNEFRFHRAEKIYVALSARAGFKKAALIVGDMEKSRRGSYKLLRTRDNPARTSFVSEPLQEQRTGLRLLWVRPITGKTHQIRVALKSVGFSILGDPLYNAFSEARQEDRTYLHALALRFNLQGKEFQIRELPREGEEFLNPLCLETIKETDPYSLDYPGMRAWKKKLESMAAEGPGSAPRKKAAGKKPLAGKKTTEASKSETGDKKKFNEVKRGRPRKRKGNPPGHRHSGN